MRLRFLLSTALVCATISAAPLQAAPVELTVSAAASFRDVLARIAGKYLQRRRDVRLRFNFGSSGALQRQIEAGAPVDVFIAAADRNMDELAARRLIEPGTRRVLAGNRLVLIVPARSRLPIRSFRDVAQGFVGRVAVGAPSVPAGQRAQEVFERLGLWPRVRAKAVRGRDVREVLAQVALGNVEAGVVYATDAASSQQVRVVSVAPASMHKPIRYPVAVVSGSRNAVEARALTAFLSGAESRAILRRARFVVP